MTTEPIDPTVARALAAEEDAARLRAIIAQLIRWFESAPVRVAFEIADAHGATYTSEAIAEAVAAWDAAVATLSAPTPGRGKALVRLVEAARAPFFRLASHRYDNGCDPMDLYPRDAEVVPVPAADLRALVRALADLDKEVPRG